MPVPEIVDFCFQHNYRCQVELPGSCLMPPEFNVSVTDWERSRKLREGKFSVLASDPHPHLSPDDVIGSDDWSDEAYCTPGPTHHYGASPSSSGGWGIPHSDGEGLMGPPELDEVRRHLEALLPESEDADEPCGSHEVEGDVADA